MPRHITLYQHPLAGLVGVDDETTQYPLILRPLNLSDLHMREEGLTRLTEKFPDVILHVHRVPEIDLETVYIE
jgi:hypothetical protein